jgi:fibrillarin-like rRNA methylase
VVLARAVSGETRRIVCGTKTSTAYLGSTSSIAVSHDDDLVAVTATVYGYEGERRRFPRPAAPEQGV